MPRVRQHLENFFTSPALVVAYPWVEPSDYGRARTLMTDGDLWPHDYDVWRREAERAMQSLASEGVSPVKATLDLEEFSAWCRMNDCAADSTARLAFAEIVALEEEIA